MRRIAFLLVVGALLGYLAGYKDGRRHDRPVYERYLDNLGGGARGKYGGVDHADSAHAGER